MFDCDGVLFTGAAEQLFYNTNQEVILYGPFFSGKSYAITGKAHLLCKKYPGTVACLIHNSPMLAFDSYKNFINESHTSVDDMELKEYGSRSLSNTEYRARATYKNGSYIQFFSIGSQQIMATQADYIGLFDLDYIQESDWEGYMSRSCGRLGNTPYSQTVGDYPWKGLPKTKAKNNDEWIWNRDDAMMLRQNYKHNPKIYVGDKFTEEGNKLKDMYFDNAHWLRNDFCSKSDFSNK